jgi:hypothetical protein
VFEKAKIQLIRLRWIKIRAKTEEKKDENALSFYYAKEESARC